MILAMIWRILNSELKQLFFMSSYNCGESIFGKRPMEVTGGPIN